MQDVWFDCDCLCSKIEHLSIIDEMFHFISLKEDIKQFVHTILWQLKKIHFERIGPALLTTATAHVAIDKDWNLIRLFQSLINLMCI